MPEEADKLFLQTKEEIDDIIAKAEQVLQPKLEPVKKVMESIKTNLAHGTDRIPTQLLHEWALSLSVFQSELTPQKEAYALASILWKLDINKTNATNLAQRRAEQRKAEVENQNVLDNMDRETQKAILDYMANVIKNTQENIYQMCSELNRILDARTRFGENK